MTLNNLSVLIVSFNCWHYLKDCIQSILASTYPVSAIIVVDNASVDGTPEKLQALYPRVRLIRNSKNLGLPRAVNQGLKESTGERILLLDADTEVEQNAIKHMSTFLDERPEVSMVAPRTLNSDGTTQETARNFPSVMNGLFGRQSILTRLFPDNRFSRRYLSRDHLSSQEPFPVQQVSAACMLFRKSILDTVGMMDEGYRVYWVDTDWCKRIQKAGGTVYCVPRAVITHHEQNKPFRKKNPARIVDFHRGAYRFYHLHYTWGVSDPRSVTAAFLLTLRGLIFLAINFLKKPPESHEDPFSRTSSQP